MSIKLLTIDLAEPLADLTGCDAYDALLALVRVKGRSLGWARVNHQRQAHVAASWLRAEIANQVHWELLPHALLPAFIPEPTPTPPITVIVLSKADPVALADCLHALLACAYPEFELLVVDYGAQPMSIKRVVDQFPAVRYLRATAPGAGAARNQGAAIARYDLVAFLAAACCPDPHWLSALAAGFSVADVAAVTGPVAPRELATPAQRLFEDGCGGLGRDPYSRTVRPATASFSERIGGVGMGSGANLALRGDVLRALGGFNPTLDAGADHELLVRLLAHGMSLRYNGDALVWHAHPRDHRALERALFDRGRSQGAALIATAQTGVFARTALLRYAVSIWLWGILGRIRRPAGLPQRLALLELLGALSSLTADRRSLTSPPGDATL